MHRVLAAAVLLSLATAYAAPSRAAPPPAFSVQEVGHGPPVILIPGLACSGEVWHATVEHYRRGHQLHVVTLAGFGGQPAIAAPFLTTVRDQLAGYIRAHHLRHPVVVGHSLGGFIALSLAAANPTLLGGLVVVDALPFLPAARDPRSTAATVEPGAKAMRTMLAGASPAAFAQQNLAALRGMITDPKQVEEVAAQGRLSDPRAVAEAVYELMVTDLRPRLPQIRVPSLVLAAGAGEAGAQVKSLYEAQYQGLRGHHLAVAERSRHFIMLDAPTFFFGQLDAFLKKVEQGS